METKDIENLYVFDCDTVFLMIEIIEKENSVFIDMENKENYISITEELFWYLAEKGDLKCPRCKSEIEYDFDLGEHGVGLQGYRMASCTNGEGFAWYWLIHSCPDFEVVEK